MYRRRHIDMDTTETKNHMVWNGKALLVHPRLRGLNQRSNISFIDYCYFDLCSSKYWVIFEICKGVQGKKESFILKNLVKFLESSWPLVHLSGGMLLTFASNNSMLVCFQTLNSSKAIEVFIICVDSHIRWQNLPWLSTILWLKLPL